MPFDVKAIGHGGNTQGCSAMLLIEGEEQNGTVVMTNQFGEGIFKFQGRGLTPPSLEGIRF